MMKHPLDTPKDRDDGQRLMRFMRKLKRDLPSRETLKLQRQPRPERSGARLKAFARIEREA